MSSPWEGGSRPVAASKTADLVAKLIDRGEHVEARLVATGILDLMTSYVNAETAIDTHPGDILRAFSACAASVFAGVISATGTPHRHDDIAELCGNLVTEMTKACLAKAGEA